MRKLSLIVLLMSFLVIFSCKKEKEILTDEIPSSDIVQDSLIVQDSIVVVSNEIQTFANPPEIQGCSSKFAKNKEDFEQGKFVYADDYGNTAYIKIEGKMVKIQMEEGEFDPSIIDRSVENEKYRVTLRGRKIKQEGETSTFEGKIRILKKDGSAIMSSVYGQNGC